VAACPTSREIRVSAQKVLMEFLVEIQVSRTVDWVALSAILVDKAGSQAGAVHVFEGGRVERQGGEGPAQPWDEVLRGGRWSGSYRAA
jgi:hypothetical protein